MAVIDRAKALHNLSFGDNRGMQIPVTTLHSDGQMTSGGWSDSASTAGVHDLQIKNDVGVFTDGLQAILANMLHDSPDIAVEGNVLTLSSKSSRYSIGLTDPRLDLVPLEFDSEEWTNGGDSFLQRVLQTFQGFASREVGRENLQSVFFTPKGIISIDGYQLANVNVPMVRLKDRYSIHAQHVRHALKEFGDDFKIKFAAEKTFLFNDESRWIISPVKGEIKDYAKLIPPLEADGGKFTYGKDLLTATQAVSKATLANEIYIELGVNVLDVMSQIDSSAARESVAVEGSVDGGRQMKFNSKMLLNVLQAGLKFDEHPTFHMIPSRKAATVTAGLTSFTAMSMSA